MLSYYLWKNKYYSKEELKYNYLAQKYSYRFRLIMCIIATIFTVPLDIIGFIPEILIWFINTLYEM